MNKNIIGLKISRMMNSEFVKEKYKSDTSDLSTEQKEKYLARLFNMILLFNQISPDEELCEKFLNKVMNDRDKLEEIPDVFSTVWHMSALTDLTEEEIAECLKHGVAVHFTTPAIAEKIKSDGKMNSLYTKNDISDLLNAMRSANPNSEYVFTTGFGIKKGICSGSVTTGYYMFHTPETLSFLFGGNFINGDYDAAMEFVKKSTEEFPEDMRENLRNKLSDLYKATASKNERTAILIDRDKIEYKKDNYYKNGKLDRQVERRPYMNGNLYDMCQVENNLIEQELDLDALFFVNVPTVEKMDRMVSEKNNDITKS